MPRRRKSDKPKRKRPSDEAIIAAFHENPSATFKAIAAQVGTGSDHVINVLKRAGFYRPRHRSPGELERTVLECFHAHPGATGVEIGKMCGGVNKVHVSLILRSNGFSTKKPKLSAEEIHRRALEGNRRRLAKIYADPVLHAQELEKGRSARKLRRENASAKEIEKERKRSRLKMRKKRAALKAKAETIANVTASLPAYVPRTTAEIIQAHRARQATRARQYAIAGWHKNRREWEQEWKSKLDDCVPRSAD